MPVPARAQSHPFLLMRSSDIPALQSRASTQPFSGIKTRAVAECNQRSFPPPCNGNLNTITGEYPSLGSDTYCMRAIMSACTLAAVLETNTATRATYINKVISTLPRWEDILIIQSGANDGTPAWSTGYLTDATAAYFNTVLAVDILNSDLAARSANISYSGLTPFTSQLQYAEFLIEQEFNHFYGPGKPVYNLLLKNGSTLSYNSAPNNYPPAKESAMILYKLYSGSFNTSDPDSQALLFGGSLQPGGSFITGYQPEMAARVNPSGTYSEGPGYAYAAWGLDRDERSHLPDLLEFTGKDREFNIDFYTNPKFQTFYEWLYGYASTPFGLMTGFSDTHALRTLSDDGHGDNAWTTSSHIGGASRYSATAGDYAAWKSNGAPQQGRLLNYLLYSPATGNSRPVSRNFTNGGAFFLSQPVDTNSLYGALWNVKTAEGDQPVFHARKDVNALYLAAYGGPLLMNGGFCGAVDPSGPDSCSGVDPQNVRTFFPGSYLGDRAVSNNVATKNYTVGNYLSPNQDSHTTNFGNGLTESFTGNGLDYARGDSGAFFTPGTHNRNFLMVHPSTGSQGYFLVIDDFTGQSTGTLNLVFHPNGLSRTEVTPLTEYTTPIFRRVQADATTGLSLFFGSAPANIQFYPGIIASINGGAIIPEYFFNTYTPDSDGTTSLLTALFPYNSTHPKASMQRIQNSYLTGISLNHGSNLIDYALTSDNAAAAAHAGIDFEAASAWYRLQGSSLIAYFVRQGRSLTNSAVSPTGFSSASPVTLRLKGTSGHIVSPGTSVTFRYPSLTAVRLNGQILSPTQTGSGFVTATIPQGNHTVDLVVGGAPPPTATSGPLPTQTPAPLSGDLNGDGVVDWRDYLYLLARFPSQFSIFNLNTLFRSL